MRLLFISNLFPDTREPYRGLDNATVLHHLHDRWEIRVLALRPTLSFRRRVWKCRDEDRAFEPQFVPAPYLPKIGSRVNHRLLARALRKPIQKLRAESPFDAVLCAWIFPDACAVAELAREFDFPFVAIAQGSDVHQYLRIPARREIIARLLPAASAVITRSAELARLLGDAGVGKAKLHPIYNGVDFATFHPADRSAARRELGLRENARTILFVGNFVAIKNPLVLIEAHARLCAESAFSTTELVMIGGGPLAAATRTRADQLGFGAQVILAGRMDAAAVARHMQAADVLCLPSDNEGVPNVILESFASGLPVVASNVGGIAEVHTGGELGRLVPPRDVEALAAALRTVLASPPSRESIAARGRQFSWQRTAAAYDAVLTASAK